MNLIVYELIMPCFGFCCANGISLRKPELLVDNVALFRILFRGREDSFQYMIGSVFDFNCHSSAYILRLFCLIGISNS